MIQYSYMSEVGSSRQETQILKSPEKPKLPPDLETQYWHQREKIKALYRGVKLWHGTGRYEDNGDIDVLTGIINARAINPHEDFGDGTLRATDTTSTTSMRPYAIMYSDMHLKSDSDLLYNDPRSGHWGRYVQKLISRHLLSLGRDVPYLASIYRKKAPKWIERKTGSTVKEKGVALLWKGFNFGSSRSSIPGDYPILIGLVPNAFEPIKTAAHIAATTELRTDKPIPIEKINHVEVPIKDVKQTEVLLNEKGINIPVLARELGERYSTEFTDRELLTGEGFAEKSYPPPQPLINPKDLETYIPQKEWFTSPKRAESFYHGIDHLIRVLILQEIITNHLIEIGQIKPADIDRNALRLSAMAHDIRRHHDLIEPGHGLAAADWTLQMFPHLPQQTRKKAYMITKAHDGKIDPNSSIATELSILKDADALDRIRLESKLPPTTTPPFLRKRVGLDEKRLRFPLSREFIPMANDLFRLSVYDENRRVENPQAAVFEAAQHMGLLSK